MTLHANWIEIRDWAIRVSIGLGLKFAELRLKLVIDVLRIFDMLDLTLYLCLGVKEQLENAKMNRRNSGYE